MSGAVTTQMSGFTVERRPLFTGSDRDEIRVSFGRLTDIAVCAGDGLGFYASRQLLEELVAALDAFDELQPLPEGWPDCTLVVHLTRLYDVWGASVFGHRYHTLWARHSGVELVMAPFYAAELRRALRAAFEQHDRAQGAPT